MTTAQFDNQSFGQKLKQLSQALITADNDEVLRQYSAVFEQLNNYAIQIEQIPNWRHNANNYQIHGIIIKNYQLLLMQKRAFCEFNQQRDNMSRDAQQARCEKLKEQFDYLANRFIYE